ncbi:MAG: hypothetical protein HOG34_06580 [Bacteroidetes bacterium]|nr:hypothetical protein [Bacteroidota bacterium]
MPLIFCPPRLDWQLPDKCAEKSDRLIVVPVYGRDKLAREGWLRLANIATYTLLCSKDINRYEVELLLQDSSTSLDVPFDYQALFEDETKLYFGRMKKFNVRVRNIPKKTLNVANLYDFYDNSRKIIIRVDADSGFMPETLLSDLFHYSCKLGESGLNFNHTRRSGFEHLFSLSGRMNTWEPMFKKTLDEFLGSICKIVQDEIGYMIIPDRLASNMKSMSWPSEGLSYIETSVLAEYQCLRNVLQGAKLIPEWDEEILKLLLASILRLEIERAMVPVIEYWEYMPEKHRNAVVNFRNSRQIAPILQQIFDNVEILEANSRYIRDFIEGT